ncbi:MAG: FAD-binding oxidoreductase [Desulfurococcales archaeon]|nr:FAD-binding oxidoreductase [Desulfurococcales archaeon]
MKRIAIIGGGILGATLAHQLSLKDAEVTLYERAQLFQEASSKAAGIITFQLYLDHDYKLTSASLSYYRRLREKGYDLYRKVKGVSLFDKAKDGEDCIQVIISKLEKWGIPYRRYEGRSLEERLPGIYDPGTLVGLETWRDYILDTGILAQALREQYQETGVRLLEYDPVLSIREQDDQVQVESENNGVEKYDYAIIASGPWGIRIAGLLGKVFLYNCQAQTVKTTPPDPDTSIYDYTDEIYIVPESKNSIITGDGCRPLNQPEEGLNPDQNITLGVIEALTTRFPHMEHGELASVWSSPCEVAMDGIPYAGPIIGQKRIFIAGGLDGYGIMRAPGIASILVDYFIHGEPIPWLYNTGRLYQYPKPTRIVINELYNPVCGHINTCIF